MTQSKNSNNVCKKSDLCRRCFHFAGRQCLVSGDCLFSCQGFPSTVSGKEKADLPQFWSMRLTVGWPWCTNRLHLRDGLRQMEMCIPFQGKGSFQGRVEMGSFWVTVDGISICWLFRKSNIRLQIKFSKHANSAFFLISVFLLGCCWSFSALPVVDFTFRLALNSKILKWPWPKSLPASFIMY